MSPNHLQHVPVLRAGFALALVLLTALAMARLVSVLPGPADLTALAAEPYHWYAANVIAP
ncbi:MAG: hypothetical protein IPJ65_31240 [Archangiaceae bacterium]|nr:hypothetical protein [Archangiaceae bacterium]